MRGIVRRRESTERSAYVLNEAGQIPNHVYIDFGSKSRIERGEQRYSGMQRLGKKRSYARKPGNIGQIPNF